MDCEKKYHEPELFYGCEIGGSMGIYELPLRNFFIFDIVGIASEEYSKNMPKVSEKKYKGVVLYLSGKIGGEIRGKKKLAKLLYFVDFDFFEKYQKSLTGDIYKALPMGPFPATMEKILAEMVLEKKITVKFEKERFDFNPTEIYKAKEKAEDIFNKEERAVLDRVILKYGHLSGKQLEDLTHAEAPYIGTAPNQEIAYELAFYRGTNMDEDA